MAKGGTKKLAAKAKRDAANRLLADNRFARHQYEILETLECGMELLGTEVKSIRAG
ncbi:MAG: SsrA-binding protein, partial [Cyanobacteriota bacterium]|nr:SsrA-binding protein [Cyanobacteriota bacterium]